MKKKIFAIAAAAIAIAGGIYSAIVSADTINEYWDFEDGNLPNWTALYSNADMQIESERNGNKYIRLSYNGRNNRGRNYYDVKIANAAWLSGVLQVDYDLMYSDLSTGKDGDIQIKRRTGPGSSETTMVSRFGRTYNNLRWYEENGNDNRIKDLNDQLFTIEAEHWYSIKIIIDLDKCMHSLYIFDRDTQELLYYMEPEATIGSSNNINMITFSSGTDMCLDNVRVYNTDYESACIIGSPYLESATKNKFFMMGLNQDGRITALPAGETTWNLETPRENVSVDSETARVIVGSSPEPGPAVLSVSKETDEGTITAKYIINISK